MRRYSDQLLAAAVVAVGFLLVYWRVLAKLIDAWLQDSNYSHGFLIVPLAAYLVWERRGKLRDATVDPTWIGLIGIAMGIGLLLAGLLGAELFISRVSIVVTLAGIVLFMFGWQYLRILAFPLLLLLLMIPIPAIILNKIAFPLQLFASQVGEHAISAANIPVLREGNVLVLATTSLEVAEACSGIRSLISLLTLGIVYGYFADQRSWVRIAVALSSVPVAILTNAARVAGTGIAASWFGAAAAEGFFHEFSGGVMFVLALGMMLVLQRAILWIAPRALPAGGTPTASAA